MANGIQVVHEGTVARVILDLPPVNAISTTDYESLIAVFRSLNESAGTHVVMLESANPKVFSAGADIREIEEIVNSDSPEPDIRRQRLARETYDLLLGLRQPTIAAVGGIALGAGAVFAACCDIRVGSESTRIGLTEVDVARCGGARHVMRILPQAVVRQMYFTAEPLDAPALYRHGAIDALRPVGSERFAALDMAQKLAEKSPIALRLAKRALNACDGLSISEGYAIEQDYTLQLGRTDDAKEACSAFLEKREPVWAGR